MRDLRKSTYIDFQYLCDHWFIQCHPGNTHSNASNTCAINGKTEKYLLFDTVAGFELKVN